VAAFRETLRELGYVEGQNLVIEAREALRASPGTTAADLVCRAIGPLAFPVAGVQNGNPGLRPSPARCADRVTHKSAQRFAPAWYHC
jgi:hypothetical protein